MQSFYKSTASKFGISQPLIPSDLRGKCDLLIYYKWFLTYKCFHEIY